MAMRTIGLALIGIGLVMAASAIVSGPHAFGLGMRAVVGMVAAGTAVALSGMSILREIATKTS